MEIPVEDREEGDENMVGRLDLSLYGTRDAAVNWAIEYTSYLKSIGFEQGVSSPCNFVMPKMELNITVHGDDFFIVGPLTSIKWMQGKIKAKYEVKCEVLGPEAECSSEIQMLGRVLRWTEKGIEYEPDQRHADILVSELGLCGSDRHSRALGTPGTADTRN